jgi:hypothetical protein
MTPDHRQRSVLVIGKSQLALDESVAGLRDLGYKAQATNDFFGDVAGRFDVKEIDLVVLGGQIPPSRQAELREEITGINPQVTFVESLVGIPGVIINQVRGAFNADHRDPIRAPTSACAGRSIRLTLADAADVKVTVWWRTSVAPDLKSESLSLLDDHLPAGDHVVLVPEHVPPARAFATVQIEAAFYALRISNAPPSAQDTRDNVTSAADYLEPATLGNPSLPTPQRPRDLALLQETFPSGPRHETRGA